MTCDERSIVSGCHKHIGCNPTRNWIWMHSCLTKPLFQEALAYISLDFSSRIVILLKVNPFSKFAGFCYSFHIFFLHFWSHWYSCPWFIGYCETDAFIHPIPFVSLGSASMVIFTILWCILFIQAKQKLKKSSGIRQWQVINLFFSVAVTSVQWNHIYDHRSRLPLNKDQRFSSP